MNADERGQGNQKVDALLLDRFGSIRVHPRSSV
jgi:hypothetical protein